MWTKAMIEAQLIGRIEDTLALEPERVVEAYRRTERVLGVRWIQKTVGHDRGIHPVISVLAIGLSLRAVEDLQNCELLIKKLKRQRDDDAISVLQAVYILRFPDFQPCEFEWEPPVGTKKADFRIRRPGEDWTTVEVCRPDSSQALKALDKMAANIGESLADVIGPGTVHLFFQREPDASAIQAVIEWAQLRRSQSSGDEILPGDIGVASFPKTPAANLTSSRPIGFDAVPMVGVITLKPGASGVPDRQVGIWIPFSDRRVDRFINDKAKQLRPSEAGLLMLHTGGIAGGIPSWSLTIKRRLQYSPTGPVSAVCLFGPMSASVFGRYRPAFETSLVMNDAAKFPLPGSLCQSVVAVREDFAKTLHVEPPVPS